MYDMTIQLKTDSEKCLYEQIYEHIRQEIREGKLLAGERLPSTRSLAEYLQISRSTIDAAYAQLTSEGYIEPRPYRGYFVCKVEDLLIVEQEEKTGSGSNQKKESLQQNAEQIFTNGSNQEQSCKYDFSPHGIDMSQFPFSVWRKITNEILSDDNSDLFRMGDSQGDYDLRVTISRYLHSSRGVNCSPRQIVVGAGTDYLLLLLEKMLGQGRLIAMENPTYKRAYRVFRSCGYQIEAVGVDENGLIVSALEQGSASAVYVMPSHQYPTGTVMPIGRRMELLKWADGGSQRFLIEDDYDSEFRYRGKPIPSLQSCDQHDKVIYIGTFSKAIAPAIRVGYMVLPVKLLKQFERECAFYASTVSRIDQRILNEFIKEGYFERHLNKMRKIYRMKHDLMLQGLECFQDAFELAGENAGLHLLLKARKGQTEAQLIRSAADVGVKVYGLSDYYIDSDKQRTADQQKKEKEVPATVILGYGGMTLDQISSGLEQLKKAWL